MKLHWFIRKGILYLPASLAGWLIFAVTAVTVVYRFIDIDSRSHSVSDTLINWVFQCLVIGVVYSFLGFLTEKKTE